MRIGIVTWAYPPEKSGLSRAAAEIAQALAGAGHDVRVVTLDRGDRSWDGAVEVIGAIRARDWLARVRRWPAIGHLAGPAMIARAIRRLHRERPFDVVEATNWYAPGLFVALAGPAPLVTRNSTPVSVSARGGGLRDRIDAHAAMLAEAVAARASAAWISNTAAHGDRIAALYRIVAPGPDHAVIGLSLPPAIVAAGRAAAYPPGNAVLRLLFVGRNEPRKGTDALLAALPALAADADAGTLPDFRLMLVGLHARELDGLTPAARRRVDVRHRVEDDELHAALAGADIVVAPSRYESFGLVYQEAMMFARPIAACAEDPSARRFVGDSGAGLLADACTGDALAVVVRRMLAQPALRATLSAAARAAAGRFTRAGLAAETVALYGVARSKGRSSAASSSGRPAPADIAS